jgi:hypothetical protein
MTTAPISATCTRSLRCPRCIGVSRTRSTRRRRSFKVTSAARSSRLSEYEVAMPDMVFIEQGATIMPAARNEPEDMDAAMSPSR